MDKQRLYRMLNPKYQLDITKNFKLKVTLKNDKVKGNGLYAVEKIKKHKIIAYYKLKVFAEDDYVSPTDTRYTFTIFNQNGKPKDKLIGDIDDNSFPLPINRIPFFGPFINEPSSNQTVNAVANPNLKYNKINNTIGHYVIYSIYTIRDIEPNDEITIYYGDNYERNYNISISEDDKMNSDYHTLPNWNNCNIY
jgi:SET domain-containing protein